MKRYVAFLRAINVGGHVVKMHDLRRHCEALGLAGVETFIQSGNLVFESAARASGLERLVEEGLAAALGYPVATFVRTTHELAEVASHRPFGDPEGGARIYVGFLRRAPDAGARDRVEAMSGETDELRFAGRELYWLCRVPTLESKVSGALVEKMLGGPMTVRNTTTVRRMVDKYC
jgi:uncharacterized protein (DUF1697 family)